MDLSWLHVREVFSFTEVILGVQVYNDGGGGEVFHCDRLEKRKLFYGETYSQSESCNFQIPFRRKLLLPSYNFLIS